MQAMLSIAPHIKAMSLDDVPVAFTQCDIHLHLLKDLEDIGKREVSKIAQKADGLFEWASLACEYIRLNTTGELVKEHFSNATVRVSREGKSLLDNMYHTTLESIVSKRPTALVCFCSVMQQVLYTLEPLPINGPDAMCQHFSHKDSNFNVVIVLHFLGPLLSGVTDSSAKQHFSHPKF